MMDATVYRGRVVKIDTDGLPYVEIYDLGVNHVFGPLPVLVGASLSVDDSVMVASVSGISEDLVVLGRTNGTNSVPGLAAVATSGDAHDLTGLAAVGLSGSAADLTGILPKSSLPALTSADVGLGNVPNINTTNAGNITAGTLSDNRLTARLGQASSLITDWNAALTNGWYWSAISSTANAPDATHSWVGTVHALNVATVKQTVWNATVGMYRRILTGGVWSAWMFVSESPYLGTSAHVVTDGPSTYPTGPSIFDTSDTGWPEIFGTVITNYITTNRSVQFYAAKSGNFYTRTADSTQTNGWTAWQTHQSQATADGRYFNASNLSSGTVPDAQLPGRLGTTPKTVTDWNLAVDNGWYLGSNTALNSPVANFCMGWVETSGTYTIQRVTSYTQGEVGSGTNTYTYQRRCNRSGGTDVWGAWYRVDWAQPELDARYAPLLGRTSYNPATITAVTTTGTALTDVDATNLAVTFTAVTTAVDVTLEAQAQVTPASAAAAVIWSLRNGTTQAGEQRKVMGISTGTTTIYGRQRATIRVTGLTVGTTYTYKWAHRVTTGTGGTAYGGTSNSGTTDIAGPAIMEVYAR